jgi:hypothetical protein
MEALKFNLNDRVVLIESEEVGTVIGRAEFTTSEPSYNVRYKAGDGRQVESWWGESAIGLEVDIPSGTLVTDDDGKVWEAA